MKLYIVQEGDTLRDIAMRHARSIHKLAAANGLHAGAQLTPGTQLFIPSIHPFDARPAILVCGEVNAEKHGFSLTNNYSEISLLLHRCGKLSCDGTYQLPRRLRLPRCFETPILSAPACPVLMPPEYDPTPCLLAHGYCGLCLSANAEQRYLNDVLRAYASLLKRKEMLLALQCNGEDFTRNPSVFREAAQIADLLFLTLPCHTSSEQFLSELSSVTSPAGRRKICLCFSPGDGSQERQKSGTPKGCRRIAKKYMSPCRKPSDCADGLRRLTADGYLGVMTPVGETSPTLYHMLCEVGQIIPTSQRSGMHSHR